MRIARFVALYSQGLAWVGLALLAAVLAADHRWLGQIPEVLVLFGSAVALRGLFVPLSKYSYLTQTALVGLAGSLLVGVPATALAIAGATVITDWLWQRKPLRVAWINLGREVITLVAAYGVYAAALHWLDMPNGAPVMNIELLPGLAGYALAYFVFGRVLFYFTLIIRAKLEPAERLMIEEAISAEELNKIHAMEAVITANISLEDSFQRIERLANRLVDWGDFRIYRLHDGVMSLVHRSGRGRDSRGEPSEDTT